ncbi:MAG: RNA polymerase sigma factor, partial [Bacillota bacterium]
MKKLQKETEELIREIKNNNMEAFDRLVLNYREAAVRFAVRYTGDYYKAEDIVQEAFAKFYLNLDSYTPQGSFSSYLFKIIRNLSIDYYRKEDRIEVQKLTRDILADDNLPEEIILAREKEGLLNRLLSKLNENYRTALYLQHYE